MSDNTWADYTIPKKVLKLLQKEDGFSEYANNFDDNGDDNKTVFITIDSARWGEEEGLETFLYALEIPFDYSCGQSHEITPNNKEIRFIEKELNHEVNVSWEDNTRYMISARSVMELLDNKPLEEVRKVISQAISKDRSVCKLKDAELPSKDRMMFLALQGEYFNIFKYLYDKGCDIHYRDKVTDSTTLERIGEIEDTELLSSIKRDLLTKGSSAKREIIPDNEIMSL